MSSKSCAQGQVRKDVLNQTKHICLHIIVHCSWCHPWESPVCFCGFEDMSISSWSPVVRNQQPQLPSPRGLHSNCSSCLFSEVKTQHPAAGTWCMKGIASTLGKPAGHQTEVKSHCLPSEPACCKWDCFCTTYLLLAPGQCQTLTKEKGQELKVHLK